MIEYSVLGKILTVNGKQVYFQNEIKNAIEFDEIVIVMTWNLSTGDIQKQSLNNVDAVDGNGKILWNLKDIIGKDGLYTIIRKDEASNLVAVEFIGMNYIVDVKNRKIVGGRAYK